MERAEAWVRSKHGHQDERGKYLGHSILVGGNGDGGQSDGSVCSLKCGKLGRSRTAGVMINALRARLLLTPRDTRRI
jgi:hypothetical protein